MGVSVLSLDTICFECRRNHHNSCREWEGCICDHLETPTGEVAPEEIVGKERDYSETEREAAAKYVEAGSEGWTGKGKKDHKIRDPHSTGRKRAAILFPLDRDLPCEWAEASNENPMGGGPFPIKFGCNSLQSHRHHGPDKNTMNNSEGNVHRICATHHNNWHVKNDDAVDEWLEKQ